MSRRFLDASSSNGVLIRARLVSNVRDKELRMLRNEKTNGYIEKTVILIEKSGRDGTMARRKDCSRGVMK